jgi:uncharacterized protein (TIGR00369 family)
MHDDFAAIEQHARDIFARQAVMATLGARLVHIEHGLARVSLPHDDAFTQQDGFLHAGIIATVVDSALGCAAGSVMPPGSGVLSIEFKINMLRPARAAAYLAEGRVLKAGRRVTVCQGELREGQEGDGRILAAMQASMICVPAD